MESQLEQLRRLRRLQVGPWLGPSTSHTWARLGTLGVQALRQLLVWVGLDGQRSLHRQHLRRAQPQRLLLVAAWVGPVANGAALAADLEQEGQIAAEARGGWAQGAGGLLQPRLERQVWLSGQHGGATGVGAHPAGSQVVSSGSVAAQPASPRAAAHQSSA